MPLAWKPKISSIQGDIAEELNSEWPQPSWSQPSWSQQWKTRRWASPDRQAPFGAFPQDPYIPPKTPAPVKVTEQPKEPDKPPEPTSFWVRALQSFSAPFDWVDDMIIKPSLGVSATAIGAVPDVDRLPGENLWEWKKRSWESWDAPGVDLNVPWSTEPWRIDIKGIMELAPWLLIPGPGQIGGSIAGIGRAGLKASIKAFGGAVAKRQPVTAARVAAGGLISHLSPWGLAEKTAGVAIKGGLRMAGKTSARISTTVGKKLFGEYTPEPIPPVVAKLTAYLKEAVIPARKGLQRELPELRAHQEAAVNKARRELYEELSAGRIDISEFQKRTTEALRGGALRPTFALTREALEARRTEQINTVLRRVEAGELTKQRGTALITRLRESPEFQPKTFTDTEMTELIGMIVNGTETGLVQRDTTNALIDLFMLGELPHPRHIPAFSDVFGADFGKAVQGLSGSSATRIVDALNLPRALLASGELSGTLRQGLILTLAHPMKAPKWFGMQIRALFSEKWALEMDDQMRKSPLYTQFIKDGGYIAPLRNAVPTHAEELFMSDFARRVPFVRRTERAFLTYLNRARLSSYEAAHGIMQAQGATPEQFKLLTGFINQASGRGDLPKVLDAHAPLLNALLFSPRLQAATLQLPRQIGRMLLSGNPYMRKEAAKALVTFVGGGLATLHFLKLAGRKVEDDPRSGDFGKIIIGETRLDIWRGYLQYIRFAAQLLTGEQKSANANMSKKDRFETAARFFQSKSSPATGLMMELLRGESYMGEPLFDDTVGFSKLAKGKLLPLAWQDVIDATEMYGINGLWVAAPAGLGVGALTFINDFTRTQQDVARAEGYDSWDDIDPKTQREIQNRSVELQAAQITLDRQLMGQAWSDWYAVGRAIDGNFREDVDNAVAQYQEVGDGVLFRNKIGEAWTKKRGGFQARQVMPQFEDIAQRVGTKDTVEARVSQGEEDLAITVYTDALWGDDMYDKFGDYRFDEATIRKGQLRDELGAELFEYVEEYMGLKFEDFPPEFHELVRAKQVMSPYWQVEEEAIKIFGSPITQSQKSRLQRFIAKVKKQMRQTNPEIAKYYRMFYSTAS